MGGVTEEETDDAGQKDKKPYDVRVKKTKGKGFHDLEIKSLLKGEKQSISMHEDALLRKVNHVAAHPDNTFGVVVADERGSYEGGAHAANYSGHPLYYKRGAGRYSLAQMHPVKDAAELKRLLNAPDDQLPEKARGRLPFDGELEKLQRQAAQAGESRKSRDKARKERNKDLLRAQARARAEKAKQSRMGQ